MIKIEDALIIKSVEELRGTLVLLSQKIDANTEANKALKMGVVAASDVLARRLELIANGNHEIQGGNLAQRDD